MRQCSIQSVSNGEIHSDLIQIMLKDDESWGLVRDGEREWIETITQY